MLHSVVVKRIDSMDTNWIREVVLLLPEVEVAPGMMFGGAILLLVAGIVAWIVTDNTDVSNLAWIKQLVPAGGAHVWWSFFSAASTGTITPGHWEEKRQNSSSNRKQLKRTLTSIGRFALRSEPVNPCVICFFVATSNERGKKALTAADLGRLMNERVLSKHERFRSRVSPVDDRFFQVSNFAGLEKSIFPPCISSSEFFFVYSGYDYSRPGPVSCRARTPAQHRGTSELPCRVSNHKVQCY
jgi:hypothetical protein